MYFKNIVNETRRASNCRAAWEPSSFSKLNCKRIIKETWNVLQEHDLGSFKLQNPVIKAQHFFFKIPSFTGRFMKSIVKSAMYWAINCGSVAHFPHFRRGSVYLAINRCCCIKYGELLRWVTSRVAGESVTDVLSRCFTMFHDSPAGLSSVNNNSYIRSDNDPLFEYNQTVILMECLIAISGNGDPCSTLLLIVLLDRFIDEC